MMENLKNLPLDAIVDMVAENSAIVSACTAEIARRAGATVSPRVPVQLDLMPIPPIDRNEVNLKEKLPDGRLLWLTLNQATGMTGCDRDGTLEKAKSVKAAIQLGDKKSPWRIHRLRLATIIRTDFP